MSLENPLFTVYEHRFDENGMNMVRKYAEEMRAALGELDAPSEYETAPMWSGTEVTTTTYQHLPIGMDPEPTEGRGRKREGLFGNGDEQSAAATKRVKVLAETWSKLPTEMVFAIMEYMLYPSDLIHLNQLRGQRERRDRAHFEFYMAKKAEEYLRLYSAISKTAQRFRSIVGSTVFRTRMFKAYMATPPEGLYEGPDEKNVVHPDEFAEKVKLSAAPLSDIGPEGEILKKKWYFDFIATVTYNEWQRALSMSTARAFQLFFWLHRQESPQIQYQEAFLKYWGIEDPDERERFRELQTLYLKDPRNSNPLLSAEQFPLTWDVDSYRLFGRVVGKLAHPTRGRLLAYTLNYQSVDTLALGRGQSSHNVKPFVPLLVALWSQYNIDVIRMIQFRNTLMTDQRNTGPFGTSPDHFPHANATGFVRIYVNHRPQPWNRPSYSPRLAALVVDQPHDVAISDEAGVYGERGSFVPWSQTWIAAHFVGVSPHKTFNLMDSLYEMRRHTRRMDVILYNGLHLSQIRGGETISDFKIEPIHFPEGGGLTLGYIRRATPNQNRNQDLLAIYAWGKFGKWDRLRVNTVQELATWIERLREWRSQQSLKESAS